jgi:hypothetical protein
VSRCQDHVTAAEVVSPAGQHQDGDLVGQLGAGQAPAMLVAGGQQAGHQVAAAGPGVPVALDELADLGAPGRHGPGVSAVAGGGQPTRQGDHCSGVDAAEEDIEGLAQAFGLSGVELGGEQGPQGDRGGEREHLVHQVDQVAVVPVLHDRRDLAAHHGHVAGQVLMAEGGLHDQALAAVILLPGRGQAIAHGCPDALVDQARSVEGAEVGQHRGHAGRGVNPFTLSAWEGR